MKKVTTILTCLALLFFAACKKENDISFNPVGKWRGKAFIYHTFLYNNQDGSSKLYIRVPGMDTAEAELKAYGTYKFEKGIFSADLKYAGDYSLLLETDRYSNERIEGMFISTLTGEVLEFDLKKENN